MSELQDNHNSFHAAIKNLETFALQNESESIPHISHLEVKEGQLVASQRSALQQKIDLANSLFTSTFSHSSTEKRDQKYHDVLDVVLQSSDVVRSYSPLIQVLEDGNPEDKKCAAHARAVIERFNKIIEQLKQPPPTWGQRFTKILYEQCGWFIGKTLTKIDIPPRTTIHIHYPENINSKVSSKKISPQLRSLETVAASKKITSLLHTVMPSSPIPKQTAELFNMKVIALLEKYCISSHVEIRHTVKNSPIQMTMDSYKCTLSQSLILFPGQVIEVKGTFQRDQKSLAFSIFIPESLEFSLRSTQTGFPHPSQHAGWSLADCLIPLCPHYLEQLTHFAPLYQRKLAAAQKLLPNGTLLKKAEKLLQLKKLAFLKNQNRFIDLHKNLSLAIAEASEGEHLEDRDKQTILSFFSELNHHPSPWNYLIAIHQILIDHFINRPNHALQDEWLSGKNKRLQDPDQSISFLEAQRILQDEMDKARKELHHQAQFAHSAFEKVTLDYIRYTGTRWSSSCKLILLQHRSEDIGFLPPRLRLIDQKIQAAAYKQMIEFLDELERDDDLEEMTEYLEKKLVTDISLFQSSSVEELPEASFQIIQELSVYYSQRFLQQRYSPRGQVNRSA